MSALATGLTAFNEWLRESHRRVETITMHLNTFLGEFTVCLPYCVVGIQIISVTIHGIGHANESKGHERISTVFYCNIIALCVTQT